MRLLCIQNGLLQQHCTNQGRRRLVACSVAFRVLGAENDHVSCRLPVRRCWIRHDAAWCRKGLRGSESTIEGGGRPHCMSPPSQRIAPALRQKCLPGRANTAWPSAYPGGGRAAEQQSSRAAEQQNGTASTLSHKGTTRRGAEPRYDIEGKSEGEGEGEGEGQGTKGANAKVDANAEADGGCGC
jgi:hypothetical protein